MHGRFRLSSQTLLLLFLCTANVPAQQETDIKTLYQKAKLKCYSQEWTGAIDLFKNMLRLYPQSRYEDDAHFWIAYCMEKDTQHKPEAFAAFSQLVAKYPDSPYVDDAVGFQIDLAEKMILDGKDKYRSFLHDQLNKQMSDMQYRAAIALGRIGDPAALPVLEKMFGNEDYGKLARDLAALLQINRMSVETPAQADDEKDIDILFKGNKIELEENKKSGFLWFGSARYELYQSMLKKDGNWSERELLDFALWHIMPAVPPFQVPTSSIAPFRCDICGRSIHNS